jgi:DNA-binding SARP family transcriptional activator
MGWCHEFGPQIREGCGHPMRAGESACVCTQCGVVCRGRFAGCAEVWARGPREVHVVSPPGALARRTVAPVRTGARTPEPSAGAEQARTEVLAWLQAAFDGLRDELSVLAGGLARQQAVLSDLADSRDSEVSTALAEVKEWAAELRNETLRLQGFEKAVAEQLRSDVSSTIEQGVERMAGVRQDDMREALSHVQERATALSAETERLEGFGQSLAEQLRAEVAQTVQEGMATLMASAAPAPATDAPSPAPEELESWKAEVREETARLQQFGDTLAESVRQAVVTAMEQAQAAAPTPAESAPPVQPAPPDAVAVVAPAPVATEPDDAAAAPVEEPAAATAPSAPEPPPARPARRSAAAGTSAVPVALELPSGALVGATLATAAVDALTLARVARRRRRLPAAPAPGLHRADPLLTDMLRRLERFALGRRAAAAGRTRPADSTGRWGIDSLPIAAGDDAEIAVDLRELNGVALTGPGAADVARAMAITFFCRHRPPAELLLVGEDVLPGAPAARGVTRLQTVDDALGALGLATTDETENDDEQDAQARARRSSAAHLVLASGIGDEDLERLRQSVDQRPDLGVAVVAVGAGAGQASATLELDGAGMLAGVEPSTWQERLGESRPFSLTGSEAAELIALVEASRREGDDLVATELNGEVCNVIHWVGDTASRDAPLVDVRMLGSFRIEVGGEEVRGGLRTKARELLAFHLLHPEGASLDAAVEALWPEADPGRGSEWFWTALGNLRSRLRTACGIKDLKIIDRVGDTYRLEVERFGVDVWRFEEALAAVHSSPDAGDGGPVEALERAAGEYGGELLSGDPWQWVEGAREDLRRRALDAVAHLAERRMTAGDMEAALAALEHGLEIDAISEELYRRTMEVQGQLSRRDAIRGTFRLLQARLAAFGLTPDPNTEKVFGELVARA